MIQYHMSLNVIIKCYTSSSIINDTIYCVINCYKNSVLKYLAFLVVNLSFKCFCGKSSFDYQLFGNTAISIETKINRNWKNIKIVKTL